MGVLQKAEECQELVSGTLTTRFVYDWRIKDSPDGGREWMRRSRFVIREFATPKRSDTYSPATGSHTPNLVPLVYLRMLAETLETGDNAYVITLAALDIKDEFFRYHRKSLSKFLCTTRSTSSSAICQVNVWVQKLGTGFSETM